MLRIPSRYKLSKTLIFYLVSIFMCTHKYGLLNFFLIKLFKISTEIVAQWRFYPTTHKPSINVFEKVHKSSNDGFINIDWAHSSIEGLKDKFLVPISRNLILVTSLVVLNLVVGCTLGGRCHTNGFVNHSSIHWHIIYKFFSLYDNFLLFFFQTYT